MFDMLRILIFCVTTASLTFGFIAANSAAENISMTQILRKCPFGTMNYLNASMTEPIQLDCADICPPDRTTDSSIFYCWVNCQDYLECFLDEVGNGEKVKRALQQRATRPNTCPSDTWFYHIVHAFISCHTVCSTLNKFCRTNCPDLYTCLMRSNRLNHSTTTANLPQVPVSEFNLRTSAAPTSTSDTLQPPRQIDTTAATTPTAHLNTVTATPFLRNIPYNFESESHDTRNSAYHQFFIPVVIVAAALLLVLLIILFVLGRLQCQAKRAQVAANQNGMNRNPDGPRDNLSTRSPTPTDSYHGYQDTEPPADSHPPTVSSFIVDMPPHDDDDHGFDETTPKTPLIGNNNEARLDPLSSGPVNLVSCDCPQPTAAEADNENSDESHTRLHLCT